MEMKTCLINQPLGIGDICFAQKIANALHQSGYKVTWPVPKELLYLNQYLISNVNFVETVPHTQVLDYDIVLNLQDADRYFAGSVLTAKYKFCGLDWSDWFTFFNFRRNKEKENALFERLQLTKDEKYTFISRKWGSPPNFLEKDVYFERDDNRVVELEFIDGFNVFDWAGIVENSSQCSIVDSSLNYLIEKLDMKAGRRYLVSRFDPPDFSHIDGLFTGWTYIK